ncbi:hypothetical protein GOBAR_DD02195 [Gossypium barbadense]|nr:hypothetical protein GOBAR_DD02195 [Gossypium barbadense]
MVHVGDRGSNKKMDDASRNAYGLEWDDAMVMVANDKGSGRQSGERETDRQRNWRSLVEVMSWDKKSKGIETNAIAAIELA